jgi:hypothetical protein
VSSTYEKKFGKSKSKIGAAQGLAVKADTIRKLSHTKKE